MTTPSPIENTTIIPPSEAKEYLAKRDIDAACLATGLTEGLAQRQNCEVYHPVPAPGYYQWSETNFSIRKFHCESNNWKIANPDNRPLLVHVDKQTKFVAAAGNSATGLREAAPGLARRKGVSTIQSVNASNQLQIGLGSFTPASHTPDARHTPPPGEWLLLYFYDEEHEELRSEFSRPASISEDGEVEAWDVRVLLKPIHPEFAMAQPDLFGTEDDDIDFTISRASGD